MEGLIWANFWAIKLISGEWDGDSRSRLLRSLELLIDSPEAAEWPSGPGLVHTNLPHERELGDGSTATP